MRLVKIDIKDIDFQYQSYTKELYDSILRIGFSFPIHVIQLNQHYQCIDGHKRLSALYDILKKDSLYKRGSYVNVIIKNNGDERSNDCWRGRNTH